MFHHEDTLEPLNRNVPLARKLQFAHGVLQKRFGFINRISVAIYEPRMDVLRTFVDSSGEDRPLAGYEAKLQECRSLLEIIDKRRPRVVNDLDVFADSKQEHARKIRGQGYHSSYTMPMYVNGTFFGFLFFNSYQGAPFTQPVLNYLDLFGHMISLVIINEISSIRTLLATIRTAREVTNQRDAETGAHLDRMAQYSRLIASGLADSHGLSDEFVEHIFLFAPLHDIGKVGVPDRILLKPARLTTAERTQMQKHVTKGRDLVDAMIDGFGLDSFQHVDVLRNIVQHHHEALDGSGYPAGLRGEGIPLEARIVTVADIFDALTSRRPYKEAWSIDDAFADLERLSGRTLDPDCVSALVACRAQIEVIQDLFGEKSEYG